MTQSLSPELIETVQNLTAWSQSKKDAYLEMRKIELEWENYNRLHWDDRDARYTGTEKHRLAHETTDRLRSELREAEERFEEIE